MATKGTAEAAMRRMAATDPELAARMILHSMPVAAAGLPEGLSYRLELDGLGAWRVIARGDRAEVVETSTGGELNGDAFAIQTDPPTLAKLAGGANPLPALASRRLRLRGKRRKAIALRHLSDEAGPREMAKLGIPVDPDLLFRALPYAIEPEWAAGHHFKIGYDVIGEGGGSWTIAVDDGRVSTAAGLDSAADAVVRLRYSDWLGLLSGALQPTDALRLGKTEIEGRIAPVTRLGRWMDRAEGVDGPELEREVAQDAVQRRRAGTWGSKVPGNGKPPGGLMDYQQLYALWERQNWKASELDFTIDKEQWLASPRESQLETIHSFGSFYVGEERVTADLAPFLLAAPSGEVEAFLATQLVDEMRHTVFFDRFMAEVMALEGEDLRARMREVEDTMLAPWRFLFDDGLRDIADRIKAKPDDLELFVQGIVTYHMVTEGVLAMPGQRILLNYTRDHDLYPGFTKGFTLVEQDEHRHIAFGVRFLKDVCAENPEMKVVVVDRLCELLPRAAEVFCPPQDDDPSSFVTYGLTSAQIYGFAYQALERRMKMIGIEIPGPEVLMPGPVDYSGVDERHYLSATA